MAKKPTKSVALKQPPPAMAAYSAAVSDLRDHIKSWVLAFIKKQGYVAQGTATEITDLKIIPDDAGWILLRRKFNNDHPGIQIELGELLGAAHGKLVANLIDFLTGQVRKIHGC